MHVEDSIIVVTASSHLVTQCDISRWRDKAQSKKQKG